MYQKAFTDITTTLDILAEQGERVAWQRTIRAKHSGAFKGFPATNLQMTWREMAVSQFKDGVIVEEWVITDLAEQFLLARKSLKK
jgi:predicted ester cyclase